ncbi:MAG: FmdB family zinc ribbon protein [Pseudomonadota bacterium]
MPLYAYKCETCGFSKDVLRKMSDPPLSLCPSCGAETFRKQVTAAGFQLKGSGWYVTDFRGGNSAAAAPKSDEGGKAEPGAKTEGAKPAAGGDSAAAPAAASPAPAAPAPAASSSPPPASTSKD